MKFRTQSLTQGGLTAAMYVLLTLLSSLFGLAQGPVQVRISEALCMLPIFFPAAVPGLAVGCFLANMLLGSALPDVVFGTLATLLGALGTYALRDHPLAALFPPVLSNVLILPPVLIAVYHLETAWPLVALSIGAGELVSCAGLGFLAEKGVRKVLGRLNK